VNDASLHEISNDCEFLRLFAKPKLTCQPESETLAINTKLRDTTQLAQEQAMRNTLKEKIESGAPAFGVSLMFPSPQLVEMIAYSGFDWVLIDCEHGSIGLADVEVMAMAADASGITSIGRPRSNSTADIQSIMDRGVKGVQIPHISTREDAERAVAAVKFGPGAKRGLAAGTRPDNWGLGAKMTDFVETANKTSLVCVQIEDTSAVANIDDILGVGGIDVFFIGPSDLSQSMGHPGAPKAPPVAQAIDRTLERIREAGCTPGMPATSSTVSEVVDKGCKYVYTHLPRLIGAGAIDFLQASKDS
jgi:4-hydroxy-2-oxoheptanedioate aldolase